MYIQGKVSKTAQKRLDSILKALDKAKTAEDAEAAAERFFKLWLSVGSKGKTKIADFGEKIGGARKDQWKQNAMTLDDLNDLNDLEKFEHVKKDNIWPKPDYKKMIDDGVDPAAAWIIKSVRDKIPAKMIDPESHNPEPYFERYVGIVERIRDVFSTTRTVEDFQALGNLRNVVDYDDAIYSHQWGGKGLSYTPKSGTAWRKLYKGLGISIEDAERHVRETGWPESNPWMKGYRIVVDGRDAWGDKKPEKEWEYSILKGPRGRGYIVKDHFNSREEAEDWLKTEYELESGEKPSKKRAKPMVRPQLKNIEREGPDYRQGKDAVGDDFLDVFKFQGGEFGNWTSQEDRRQSMNHAFDAMRDLADVLEIPPEALGLHGRLSIAFGARGGGKFAAHYEPARQVINLTKMRGAGSLAHEYGHAFDHLLGDMMGNADPSLAWAGTTPGRMGNNMRPELAQAFENLKKAVFTRTYNTEEFIELKKRELEEANEQILAWGDKVRKTGRGPGTETAEFLDKNINEKAEVDIEAVYSKFDRLLKRFLDPPLGRLPLSTSEAEDYNELYTKTLREMRELRYEFTPVGSERPTNHSLVSWDADDEFRKLIWEKRNRKSPNKKTGKMNILWLDLRRHLMKESYEMESEFSREARKIDRNKKGGYWGRPWELFARAFESHVQDKIEGKLQKSDYLVHSAKENAKWGEGRKPYPEGKERDEINRAFARFFEELRVKDEDSSILEAVVEQAEELADEREEEEKARLERGFSFSEFGKSNEQPF